MVELSSLDHYEAAEVLFAERYIEVEQLERHQSSLSSSSSEDNDTTGHPARGIMHTMLGSAPFSDESDIEESTNQTDF